MNLSTIEQGDKLDNARTKGEWRSAQWDDESCMSTFGIKAGEQIVMTTCCNCGVPSCSGADQDFILFLANHASELLQMAREVEELKSAFTRVYEAMNDGWWDMEGSREFEEKDFVRPEQLKRLQEMVEQYITSK